jgi:hypothetical protein
MFNNFFPENFAVCEIMWKIFCRVRKTIFDNKITVNAHCMLDDRHSHTEYVTLIAFLLLQWLTKAPVCYVICALPVLLFFPLAR